MIDAAGIVQSILYEVLYEKVIVYYPDAFTSIMPLSARPWVYILIFFWETGQ